MDEYWTITASGRPFVLNAPTEDMIDIRDIAHALSNICRFGGHTSRFYSVAEHCVHVSLAVPRQDALWGLLHDASEAYLGDVTWPLKQLLPAYKVLEDKVMDAICAFFALPHAMPASVREADLEILVNEKQALLPSGTMRDWMHVGKVGLPKCQIYGWTPEDARTMFLHQYMILKGTSHVS